MNPLIHSVLVLAVAGVVLGAIISVIWAVRHAEEGSQLEDGYHRTSPHDRHGPTRLG